MATQVPFKKFVPVALLNGLLAGVWVFASARLGVAAWVAFIAWSLWYTVGPTPAVRARHFKKNLIGALGGVVCGIVAVVCLPLFTAWLGELGLPVLIFCIVTAIVLLELTDTFELASSYFFALASWFGFVYGGYGRGDYLQFPGPAGDHIYDVALFVGLLLTGFLLGWLSDVLAFRILYAEGLTDPSQQQTVFDKES